MNNNIKKICVLATALATSLVLCARPGPGGGPGRGSAGPRGGGRAPVQRGPVMRGSARMPGGGGGGGSRHHHNHHHRGSTGAAIGAGILGAGLLAETIYDATHPRPVVVEPAPVVQPVVQPVVVTPTPVVTTGHYETRVQQVWVGDRYIDQTTPQGTTVRVFQPGHYEQQSTQVWVTP